MGVYPLQTIVLAGRMIRNAVEQAWRNALGAGRRSGPRQQSGFLKENRTEGLAHCASGARDRYSVCGVS